ncbi:tetratricopeptide repeat protein [Chloracidobacterium sp. MS 40/45]|uniref:tetratricopeptide repeat protein n=1 Tax=Chloracidobacterium aggregatum TaxID=2851959 RepID=UPI001B8BBE1A|nr:tetratricopeptide repeat protein [Chloracidobacterium aggregatum]QUV99877.1 tetratricopeptide repeat protein [Chloracidobacterium sp. MS 40/45]
MSSHTTYLRTFGLWLCLLTTLSLAQSPTDTNSGSNPKLRYGDPGYVGARIGFDCQGCSLPDVIQGILVKAGVRFEFPEAQQWQRVADTVVVNEEPWNEVLDVVLARHQLQATWSELGRLVIARRLTPVATGPGKLGQLLTGLPPVPANITTLNPASRAIEAERFFREGIGYFFLANPDDSRLALVRFAWATRIFDEIEYAGREATTLYMLGAAYLDLGQTARAREAFQRARDFGQNAGNQRAVVLSEVSLAYLDALEGKSPETARRAAAAGLDFFRQATARTNLSSRSLIDRELDAMLVTLSGRLFFRLGDMETAYQAFDLGFDAYTKLDDGARGVVENAVWLERCAGTRGRRTEAQQAIEAGRSVQRGARSARLQIALLAWMGMVYGESGDLKKALELQREALTAIRQLSDLALETGVQWNLARIQAALGNYADARRSYENVLKLTEKESDPFWRTQVQEALARLP